jgi:hypothetical protein
MLGLGRCGGNRLHMGHAAQVAPASLDGARGTTALPRLPCRTGARTLPLFNNAFGIAYSADQLGHGDRIVERLMDVHGP